MKHKHHPTHAPTHDKKARDTRRMFPSSLVPATVLAPSILGQQQTASSMAERFRQMSDDYEHKGLAEPFKGITTNGNIEPGLFRIQPTGVSTEPVRIAAEKFI